MKYHSKWNRIESDTGEIIDVNNTHYTFKVQHSFTNLIVSSEISAFLFFLPKKIVNNKVSYRKIMSLVNYITTYSFTPQLCSAYLTMGL